MPSATPKTALHYRALHALWRLLPRALRRGVLRGLVPRFAPAKDRVPPAASLPIAVAGQLITPSGMGHGARIQLAALGALGLAPRQLNLSHAFNVHNAALPAPQEAPLAEGTGGSLVLHVNAPYVPYVLGVAGRHNVAGRRLIGYWHWELPQAPESWRRGTELLHEIWVPTRFVAEALRPLTNCPLQIVPHPIPRPPALKADRTQFGWAPGSFVVLVAASVGSGFFRKNVLGAIACFRRAFGTDAQARLVVKLSDLAAWPRARQLVQEAIGHAANIELLEQPLSRQQLDLLILGADVVLSLHRAEGFGMIPAEAMRLGKAVIATGWSGNMDFMDEQSSALVAHRLVPVQDPQRLYDLPGARWAEPDLDHAVEWLRRLRADAALRRRLGEAGRAKAEASFGLAAYAAALARALPDLKARLAPAAAPPAQRPASPPTAAA